MLLERRDYTYRQWLDNTIQTFKESIVPHAPATLDEKQAEHINQLIFTKLRTIESSWTNLSKSSKINDLVGILNTYVLPIDPLQTHTFILACRIKTSLDTIHIISNNIEKGAINKLEKKEDGAWFYELVTNKNVKIKLDEAIELLDKRIKSYSGSFDKTSTRCGL